MRQGLFSIFAVGTWQKGAAIDPRPVNDDDILLDAFNAIKYAGQYHIIESFHIMLGKDWVDVAVALEQKQVRFKPSADDNMRKLMAGYEEGFSRPPIPHEGARRDRMEAAVKSAGPHINAVKHELARWPDCAARPSST